MAVAHCKKSDTGNSFDYDIEKNAFEFQNRKIYKNLSAEILKNTPDDKLEITIMDCINQKLTAASNKDLYLKKLSRPLQVIYIISTFEEYMNNGGFISYFLSEERKFSHELEAALNEIEAYKTEKIVSEAIYLYNKYMSAKQNRQEDLVKQIERELDKYDELFYRNDEEIEKLKIEYIKKNIEKFVLN